MFSVIIIGLISLGLILHRYLTVFYEEGRLPYSFGFTSFVGLFAFTYLVSFIWMFGVIVGIIISLLCFFQIVNSAILWIFLTPWLLSINRNQSDYSFLIKGELELPQVNLVLYAGFSFLIVIIGVLTIINFFVSQYSSIWEMMEYSSLTIALATLIILIVGSVLRVIVMQIFLRS